MTKAHTLTQLIADVDTGIDDMLALLYLGARHRAGELHLAGVSANAGNTTATMAANNSRLLLDLIGCEDVPVAVGANAPLAVPLTITPETHGAAGLGYVIAPGNEQVGTIQVRPGEVPNETVMHTLDTAGQLAEGIRFDADALWGEVLATHPQSRLLISGPGTLAARHPELAGRFAHVTLMGGAVDYPGNTTPTAEWNFWSDPEAAQAVLSMRPTLLSLQISEQITVTPTELAAWPLPVDLRPVVSEALRFYFEFHRAMGEGYLAQVHDLAAAMIATQAVAYAHTTRLLSIDPKDRGAVRSGQGHAVELVTSLRREDVLQEFRRALHLL